ncbi:MAG TPA: VOC family protein [Verrucomicrobiae bacterium]|jgi:uncharacterized glyoxalase superfamily protein PhnB|nr:VOC family protein [Verrucomicrobiae bacterium]
MAKHQQTVTPTFTFKDSRKAIEYYKKAFGAKLLDLYPRPDGSGTMHATIQIAESVIMMGDEMPGSEKCGKSAETIGASPIGMYLSVPDVDATFKQAVAAGGKELMAVADMFWGARVGQVVDPFGYSWMIATPKQDLTHEQVQKAADAFFAQAAGKR